MTGRWGRVVRRLPWQVALLFSLFFLHSLLFRAWLVDDAGISFAYARNLVHGYGLVSQPGLEPVEGFSNPLWTLLIAPLFIGDPVDPTLPIKVVSLGLMFATFLLVHRISRTIFGPSWWARATTAAVLVSISLNTSFVVWTVSGLENPLYAFLTALYVLLTVRCAIRPDHGADRWAAGAGLCAAGLALTRPDGVIFLAGFPLAMALRAATHPAQWKREIRPVAIFALLAALPVIAYTLFRWVTFGDIYPNTYHAKGGPTPLDVVRLLLLTKYYVYKTYELFEGMFSWAAGIVLLLFAVGVGTFALQRYRSSPAVYLFPALLCAWAIYCLLPRDWMNEYRFATPFLLLFSLVAFAVLAASLMDATVPPRVGKAVFTAVVTLFAVYSAIVYVPRSLAFAREPTIPFTFVAQTSAAKFNWYARELGISNASFLCPDLGGTLYFSEHRVYDLAGLCDRRLAELIANPDRVPLRDYVFNELRPTFVQLRTYWSINSGFYLDARFRELYTPIWEQPDAEAASQGHSGIYSGDYVLKEALPPGADLQRIREALGTDAPQNPLPHLRMLRPFPRG